MPEYQYTNFPVDEDDWVGGRVTLLRCSECKALIDDSDMDGHTDWHERLERTAATAQEADRTAGLLRPLGGVKPGSQIDDGDAPPTAWANWPSEG